LSLVEEGRLDLDMPANNYLTRWKLTSELYNVKEVTIRSLLTHQSGLNREYDFKDNTIIDSVPSIENALLIAKFIHEPNTVYSYSNIGFGILQLVIEEVTDSSFNSYVENKVMKPLGMEKSTFVYQDSLKHKLATFYNTDNTKSPHFRYAEQAATSLYTTPNEFSKFLLAHIKKNPVLKKENINLLNTYYFSDGGYFGQGLGVRIYDTSIDNHTMIGQNGLGRWAINSSAIIDLDSKDGVIIFCNGSMDFAKYLGNIWIHWNKGIVTDSVQFENLNKMIKLLVIGALVIIIIGFVLERRKKTVGNNMSYEK
jgi:CubicO group peptidase (beta-lactamase class C family)